MLAAVGLWPIVNGPWSVAHGLWHGPWPMAYYGLWPKTHGLWPIVDGLWLMAHGPWPMARRPLMLWPSQVHRSRWTSCELPADGVRHPVGYTWPTACQSPTRPCSAWQAESKRCSQNEPCQQAVMPSLSLLLLTPSIGTPARAVACFWVSSTISLHHQRRSDQPMPDVVRDLSAAAGGNSTRKVGTAVLTFKSTCTRAQGTVFHLRLGDALEGVKGCLDEGWVSEATQGGDLGMHHWKQLRDVDLRLQSDEHHSGAPNCCRDLLAWQTAVSAESISARADAPL